ncbi:DUF998 domain-containing protein [Mycobacterium sp. 1423905.2]|uniref:DUF998 domain-containing protein n=1 Tax=Mycobacterium sp. 1423905.2 TaxID=1856859 RepID=UPI0015600E62|nr:DUF998 domain-containing protein [Mycobacterium sp. 1423905.2]
MPARRKAGAVAWIAATLGYLSLEFAAAGAMPGYSYADNYISLLGLPARSPRAGLMNAAFGAQGVLLLFGALLLARGRRTGLFIGLVAANTVGNIVVATVHSGSVWHGCGAVFAIAGGNAAILTGARCLPRPADAQWYRRVSDCVAGLGFVGLVLFLRYASSNTSVPCVGVWERLSVYSILLWQALTAALLLRGDRRGD